ncbi:unnamed protein product [Rangifer tarandus platyrhynchus]|uniref:USP domain-containing protein n=1 Tax=Rangifer tarandus platyrhynchus TaxID=3082113 RepID=A0ABN8XLR5_RANTA|nr:unnamed protein product [Rangifer tarandus platyrhynchus]CAI9689302.1 unnamed protein product [Rangifer tarandus platyrhynchus]CAI9689858.1 unnamed protein product [Rangifer tarandus platyrhynchus]CAI9690177.1 unnamed protein product [Rangifer tarandus platyrhynchus]
MQRGCLSASQPSGHPSEDTTLIRQIFGGTCSSQIQCVHCLGVSDTFDPYLDISLDTTAAQSVEQALRELVKPEKLDVENAYDCGVCLRKVPATKRLTLHRTSQVLVLVLKRFTQVSGAKRAQEVRYPQCLDLQPFTSERKAGPLGYVLYAVLVHSGWSGERGHYFSFVRAGNGQCYKMGDAKVTACDESAALSQGAYILFYSREGAWQGGAGGGSAAPLTPDPTHPGEPDPAGPGEPVGEASGRAPGTQVSPGATEVEGISLEQWRRLKEHNRPKTASDLWKIQSALPAGPVVIHQSKHGAGRNGKLPEAEHDRLDRSSMHSPPPGPMSVGNGPCASGRARATKRKNKKPRPSLGLWRGQGSRPSAAGADALRGPSVPEVSSPALGWPQRGDLAPGSAGLAPGHQVALSWRGPWGVGAGLQNLGNTCYVNAVLHCLSHTPPLARWNVSQQHATLYPARTSCTLCAGRAHVTRTLLHPGEVIRPRKDLPAGFHRH